MFAMSCISDNLWPHNPTTSGIQAITTLRYLDCAEMQECSNDDWVIISSVMIQTLPRLHSIPPTPPPNIPYNIRLQHILSTRLTGAPNQRGIDIYQLCCIFPTPLGLWWDQMLLLKWLFTWYELYYMLKLVAEGITWPSLLNIYRVLCIVALPKIQPHLYKGTDSVLSKYILG